jgi:hypothetical protein
MLQRGRFGAPSFSSLDEAVGSSRRDEAEPPRVGGS